MKTILIIMFVALLLIIVGSVSYVAGKARGFSDCYKMTHTEENKHEKGSSHRVSGTDVFHVAGELTARIHGNRLCQL